MANASSTVAQLLVRMALPKLWVLAAKVTIDCARLPPTGAETDMDDDVWWLHLYVMFSRATRMSDMLLLRPPPRALLERGPPANVREQLQKFADRADVCRRGALLIARDFGMM